MLANREGLFHAYPVDLGLAESRQSRLLQVSVLYRLFEEFTDGKWVDCAAERLEITGYHILEKRDHSLNETTIEALKAALGWDGRDPFWLQDHALELAERPVQVRLAYETYNGQPVLKVQFLNPYGSQRGGVTKGDDTMRRSVGNRLGAKFRALAGGTPANPAVPAGSPAPAAGDRPAPAAKPAAKAVARPAPAPAAPAGCSPEQAWERFVQHCPPPKWDQQATEAEWFRILAELFPGRQPDQLAPADWARMRDEGPGRIIPF